MHATFEHDEPEADEPSLIEDLLGLDDGPRKDKRSRPRDATREAPAIHDDPPAREHPAPVPARVAREVIPVARQGVVPHPVGRPRPQAPPAPATQPTPAPRAPPVVPAPAPPVVTEPPRDAIVAWLKDELRDIKASLDERIATTTGNLLETRVRDMVLRDLSEQLRNNVRYDVKRAFQAFDAGFKDSVTKEASAMATGILQREFTDAFERATTITGKLLDAEGGLKQALTDEIVPVLAAGIRQELQQESAEARQASRSFQADREGFKRDMKGTLKGELKGEIITAVEKDLVDKFKADLRTELLRDIKEELQGTVTVELANRAVEAGLPFLDDHVTDTVKKRASAIAAGMDVEDPVHLVFIDFNNIVVLGTNYQGKLDFKKVLATILGAIEGMSPGQGQVAGHVFYSKQHEKDATYARLLPPECREATAIRLNWHLVAGRKMKQDSNTTGYRDVDVSLAVKAASAIAGTTNVASLTIASGDGDYKPVFKLAKRKGIYTILTCFKHGSSSELKHLVDKVQFIPA